jgi:hypothetical protein
MGKKFDRVIMSLIEFPLNELSVVPKPRRDADDMWNSFLELCIKLRKIVKKSISITYHEPFSTILIYDSESINLRGWIDKIPYKDQKSFFLNILTKTPYLLEYPEYYFNEKPCKGLGLSNESSVPTLSLVSDKIWQEGKINIRKDYFDKNDIESIDISVNNISSQKHLDLHHDILLDLTKIKYSDHVEFWAQKHDLFAQLIFCDSVKHNLEKYPVNGKDFRTICERLSCLNEETLWNGDKFLFNNIQFKNNPESETRIRDYEFELTKITSGGKPVKFSWHFRFGSGRIYFQPDTKNKKVIIGYIGEKIGRE